MQFELAGFELGHVRSFLDEMIQAIAFFVDDGEKFFLLRGVIGLAGEKIGDGSLDGSERSAEIVGDGIEQR